MKEKKKAMGESVEGGGKEFVPTLIGGKKPKNLKKMLEYFKKPPKK